MRIGENNTENIGEHMLLACWIKKENSPKEKYHDSNSKRENTL